MTTTYTNRFTGEDTGGLFPKRIFEIHANEQATGNFVAGSYEADTACKELNH